MNSVLLENALLLDDLRTGGPVVAVLVAMSILGSSIVLLKLWQMVSLRVWDRRFLAGALHAARQHDYALALEGLETQRNPIALPLAGAMRVLRDGLDESVAREEAERLALRMLSVLRAYLRPLEVVATLAPLLGLLGTVLGMIDAFRALETAGNQVDPSVLSGGIWKALMTTAVGLGVAIPTVVALNWLERVVDRLQEDMQDALTQLFTASAGAAPVDAATARSALAGTHAY